MGQATKEDRYENLIARLQTGSARMNAQEAIGVAGRLYTRGQHRQAEILCRKLIQQRPALADAHSILGVAQSAQGNARDAIASLKRAIKLNPKVGAYHSNLGELYRKQGNLADAIMSLQAAIDVDPSNPNALNNLGIVRFESQAYVEAVDAYRKAIAINPSFAEAHNNLGNALRKIGDRKGAADAYRTALSLRDTYPEAFNNLGTLLHELGRTGDAEKALREAIRQQPGYLDAHVNLAKVYYAQRKDAQALRQLRAALDIKPGHVPSLIQAARIQTVKGNHPSAQSACRQVLRADPNNAEALTILGKVLHDQDRFEDAAKLLSRSIELQPGFWEPHVGLAMALRSLGRIDEARDEFLKALEINGKLYGAYASLGEIVDFSKEKALARQVQNALESVGDQQADAAMPLHFAYGKVLEDTKKYEKALEHYIIGGRLKRRQVRYDEKRTFAFFEQIRNVFSADFLKSPPFAGIETASPIFIVGMPNSGSAWVDQVLAGHGAVHGAGETKLLPQAINRLKAGLPGVPAFPDIAKALSKEQFESLGKAYLGGIEKISGGKDRATDALLTNYFFLGLLHVLFPRAKFINVRRDPIDTCLATFTTLYRDELPQSYDLGELGRFYRQYDALMTHWEAVLPEGALHTVKYEDIAAAPEKAARALVDFLDLDWRDSCLDFQKAGGAAQGRKSVYKSSVKQWKKYGAGLQPLIDAIES